MANARAWRYFTMLAPPQPAGGSARCEWFQINNYIAITSVNNWHQATSIQQHFFATDRKPQN